MNEIISTKKSLEEEKKSILNELIILNANVEKKICELNQIQKKLDVVDDEIEKIRINFFYDKSRRDDVFVKKFIEGKSNYQISREIFCSEDYVRKLVQQIKKKHKI